MSKVSVLIPAYNEELSLPELYSKLKEMMDSYAEYEWEILFVNDGSHNHQTIARSIIETS